jgi:hypothetical protein
LNAIFLLKIILFPLKLNVFIRNGVIDLMHVKIQNSFLKFHDEQNINMSNEQEVPICPFRTLSSSPYTDPGV